MELRLVGVAATVEPLSPVLPKNVPSGVHVVVNAGSGPLTADEVTRFLGDGWEVKAELSGPGLAEAITVPPEPVEGDPFLISIPGLSVAGDYKLANIRIEVDGKPAIDVVPREIPVDVIAQVLITAVKTRALTLDEIRERGIELDRDDYEVFDFTIGMTFESEQREVKFAAAFDRDGVSIPLPKLPLPEPAREGVLVKIPGPGALVPFMMGPKKDPEEDQPGNEGAAGVRIPAVIVIPGNVGFLKQFFSAQLYVANATPAGSGLSVRDLSATITLPVGDDRVPGTPTDPGDDPLVLAKLVDGGSTDVLPLLAVGPDGVAGTADDVERIHPGEQAEAEFLIRAEREGFHPIEFDIDATLEGLPTGDVEVTGQATGGVLVRNPFFDMSFSLPAVVRRDESFTMYVTISNVGEASANDVTVSLDRSGLSGLRLKNADDAAQNIPTLEPGDSASLAYDLVSERTGRLTASYLRLDADAPATGTLEFTVGIGERGVPLSPDTLALPSSVEFLRPEPGSELPDVVRAATRVLGQALSVVNAPAGSLPADVTRISRSALRDKALALSEAGLRVQLGTDQALAFRDLAFDFYGGEELDEGFDELLRGTDAGRDLSEALGLNLAGAATLAGGIADYERETAELLASGPDFLTFGIGGGVDVVVTDGAGRSARSPLDEDVGIPGMVLLPLGSSEDAPVLGILKDPRTPPYTIEMTGQSVASTQIAVTLPGGHDRFLRGTELFEAEPGARARIVLDTFRAGTFQLEEDRDGDELFEDVRALSEETLYPQGPTLVAASVIGRQVLEGAQSMGVHMIAVFDRIVDEADAANVLAYSIPDNAVQVSKAELSGRLVFLSLEQPEGPFFPTTLTAGDIGDRRRVRRAPTTIPVNVLLEEPGAIVSGRVFNADGSPVASGQIIYSNHQGFLCEVAKSTGVSAVPLRSDGRYELRYVRRDPCGGPFGIAYQDPETGEVSHGQRFVRTDGEHITVDLALFGRGSVTGLVQQDGQPVPGASVVVLSGTDPQSGGAAETDGAGRFAVHGIVVGPVSVKAAAGGALGSTTGRIPRAGGTGDVVVNLDGGTVAARGTVRLLEDGEVTPIPGIPVIYALKKENSPGKFDVAYVLTDANGQYELDELPTGEFVLTAALTTEEQISITGVAAAGDVLEEDLVIRAKDLESPEFGTVRGIVLLPDGSPASDVVVEAGRRGVLNQADGTFEIPGVKVEPFSRRQITARSRDGLRSGSASFVLNAHDDVVDVTITLSGFGEAVYTLLDPQGQPMVNQEVRIGGTCSDACGCVAKRTDESGRVRFGGLRVGTTGAKSRIEGNGYDDIAAAAATITRDGEIAFATLQFRGIGTVRGTVYLPDGRPAHGADVALGSRRLDPDFCDLVGGVTHRARTDTEGRFEFRNVNVGSVSVTATHPFLPTAVGSRGNLANDGDVLELDVQLVDTIAGELTGTVFLPDGETPAGAGVFVTMNGPLPDVVVETDENGVFGFAAILPQGSYTLTVRDPVTGGRAQERIYLGSTEDVVHDVRLLGRGTVKVRVVDGANEPVTDAFVQLTEIDFPRNVYEGVADASNEGVVTFPNVFEGRFTVEGRDVFARGGRVSSTLPRPGDEVEVKLALTTTGTVRGRFLMPDSTPIPYGIVRASTGRQGPRPDDDRRLRRRRLLLVRLRARG